MDGCQDGTPFYGSTFQYLAANVVDENRRNPILPENSVAARPISRSAKITAMDSADAGEKLLIASTNRPKPRTSATVAAIMMVVPTFPPMSSSSIRIFAIRTQPSSRWPRRSLGDLRSRALIKRSSYTGYGAPLRCSICSAGRFSEWSRRGPGHSRCRPRDGNATGA